MAQAKRKKISPVPRKSKPTRASQKPRSEKGWQTFGGGFGVKWEPKTKGAKIEGIVTVKRKLPPVNKGGKPGGVVEISAHDGHSYSVFASSTLQAWFAKVKVGDMVRVIYNGTLKPRKKGQQGMKLMEGSIKE